MSNTIYCLVCNKETSNHKFCSQSCSATHNNKGVRRHGNPKQKCLVCGNETKSCKRKYCSITCFKNKPNVIDETQLRLKNRIRQAKYRSKKLRQLHPSANSEKVNQIYKNCPPGHEVDHIVPLSLGGWHHEDNLQYLTIEENRRKSNRYIG
jgi:5-methylcytosine-specific restriction endonuclease McrA